VQGSTAVILLNFCAKFPPHRQAENRYKKPLDILASGLGDIEKTKMITSNNKSTYENKRT